MVTAREARRLGARLRGDEALVRAMNATDAARTRRQLIVRSSAIESSSERPDGRILEGTLVPTEREYAMAALAERAPAPVPAEGFHDDCGYAWADHRGGWRKPYGCPPDDVSVRELHGQ